MTTDPYSYDPATWFDSFYKTQGVSCWLTDRQTIGLVSAREASYHYCSLQNLMLESIGKEEIERVLDFGAGAGHWTSFALDTLGAKQVDAIDTSSIAREHLDSKYKAVRGFKLFDSLYKTFTHRYDAVFAVGVLFHLVRDDLWERTLHRLIERLAPSGRLFVTEAFDTYYDPTVPMGGGARDVQFHATDHFSNWTECYGIDQRPRLVHKRLRDARMWNRVVEEAGAKVERLWINKAPAGYIVPENNLMVVRKED